MPTVTTSDEARMRAALHEAFERDLALLAAAVARQGGTEARTRNRWARFAYFLLIHQRADRNHQWPVLRAKAGRADLALLGVIAEERRRLATLVDAVDATARRPASPDRAWRALSNLMIALTRHHRHETRLAEATAELFTRAERVALYWERRRLAGLREAASFYPWLLDGAPAAVRGSVLRHLPPTDRLLYHALWRPRYARTRAVDHVPESRILT
ncbi:hypothetical protein [Nonomuraea sp. NPDC023979]|uniref:hypothetical protein n=1 Tax=Nonomuraea sp. NPDC023979 TaxID=3154796 RepID=UPI0033CC6653